MNDNGFFKNGRKESYILNKFFNIWTISRLETMLQARFGWDRDSFSIIRISSADEGKRYGLLLPTGISAIEFKIKEKEYIDDLMKSYQED